MNPATPQSEIVAHDRGPWAFDEEDLSIRNADGMVIAGPANESAGWRRESIAANARLIAAAPMLLEALKRVIGPHDGPLATAAAIDDRTFAQDAIAAAEGK